MNQHTYRPDAKSYIKLGLRAIGPQLVWIMFFGFVRMEFSDGPEWILGLLFFGPFLLLVSGLIFALSKRYANVVEIHTRGGSIVVIEKTLTRKLDRQIGTDEKFRLMKVNTLGQLTEIASSEGYTFGSFLSEEQLESILLLLERQRK